jgi:DNA-binding MarR family transcriptional regulator
MAFDRLESPGHVVNYLARLFAGALYRRIGQHGVNTGQFPVLLLLWEQDGVTQASLVEKLAVEQPTMAGTLKRMERDGLIKRVADPNDGRQSHIHLTRKGRALEDALVAGAKDTNAMALAGLTAAECAQFAKLARRMIENLERDNPAE